MKQKISLTLGVVLAAIFSYLIVRGIYEMLKSYNVHPIYMVTVGIIGVIVLVVLGVKKL